MGWQPSRSRVLAVAMIAVFAITVMGNLDGTLRQTVLPNGISGSIADIASPTTKDSKAVHLLGTWEQAAENTDIPGRVLAKPGDVASAWILIDSAVLAPVLAALLILISLRRRVLALPLTGSLIVAVPVLAGAYLVCDLLENLSTAAELYWPSWPHWVTRVLSGSKLAYFVMAAVAIVLSFVEAGRELEYLGPRPLLPIILRLRVPVAGVVGMAAVLLFLPGPVSPQLVDVVRTLTWSEDRAALLYAGVATAMISAVVWATGSLALGRTALAGRCDPVVNRARLARLGGVGVLLGLTGWAQWAGAFQPTLWVVLAIMVFVVVSAEISNGESEPMPDRRDFARRVLASLTAAPFVIIAIAMLRAADLVWSWQEKFAAGVTMAILITVAVGVWTLVDRHAEPNGVVVGVVVIALAVVTGGLGLAIGRWPLELGWEFGSIAILLLAVSLVCVQLFALEHLAWWTPPGVLRALRVRRFPIVTVVVAAVMIVGQFDTAVDFHRVRLDSSDAVGPKAEARPGASVDDLATSANAANGVLNGMADGRSVKPLFVIAASGGGGRAAYWTTLVTNCLFVGESPDPAVPLASCDGTAAWSQVAVASGISGGSVGLAMFDAAQLRPEGVGCALPTGPSAKVALDDVFEHEGFLDPAVAGLIFRDAVFNIWRKPNFEDRAAVLERAFEDALPNMNCGFFETQAISGSAKTPMLFLNSASVQDGCRINVSVLDGSTIEPADDEVLPSCVAAAAGGDNTTTTLPATRDIVDFVCTNQDLKLSTAALLSARFPYVSPSGALTSCGGRANVFAVDGGVIEASAAGTAFELIDPLVHAMEEIDSKVCVQPVVIQIDNGYALRTASQSFGRTPELLAPIVAVGSSSGLAADRARQSLALASSPRCDLAGDSNSDTDQAIATYIHLYPEVRPGIEAPLGWSLSIEARDDLHLQLQSRRNAASLCAAKAWLGGSLPDAQLCAQPESIEYEAGNRKGLTTEFGVVSVLVLLAPVVGLLVFCLLSRRWLFGAPAVGPAAVWPQPTGQPLLLVT